MGRYADDQWARHGKYIAGEKGWQATHLMSVKSSHPSFPIFTNALGSMPMLSNGAKVNLWGTEDPVFMAVLNVNHSRSRKSRLTSTNEFLAASVDRYVGGRLE